MITRDQLGDHHLLTLLGRQLPFPGGIRDGHGHFLRVMELGYVRHPTQPSLSVFRAVFRGEVGRTPLLFQAMVQILDPNLQGLDEGSRTLVQTFQSMSRTAFFHFTHLLRPMGHPKWLRRARKHQRRG